MGIFLAGALIAGAVGARACSSPKSLGSDISIVTHNDLYGVNTTRTDAVITFSGRMSKSDASAACSSLNEGLWNPQNDDFLQYLVYQNKTGPYWTAGGCTSLSSNGPQTSSSCSDDMKLPVLCSQYAPVSTSTKQDNSTQWWIETQTQGVNAIGFRDHSAFRFEGIRYAAQPQRFGYSSVYTPTADYNALSFQSQCVQAGNVGTEDCLWLNVWTPFLPVNPDQSTELKPVMFWIHGGAFTGGTGADPTVDGDALASRGDVVVVTINYRLTTLGFLALNDGSTNGNYGLGDMVTALEWVQANIKSFGGDPSKVTIFGQSAGAGAVRALLGSPPAFGKYAAAIPQSNLAGSNYASTYSDYYNISTVDKLYSQQILNATGCLNASSHVDCLRGVSPYLLANLTTVARFPVVDGKYILTPQIEVSGRGQVANVPLMMGHMRDDAAAFIGYPKFSNLSVGQFLPTQGFTLSNATLALFPVPDSSNTTLNVFNASSLVATDSEFRCLDQATVYSAVNHAVIDDIYFYEFNRSYQTPGYNPNAPVCQPPIEPGYPYGNPNKEYFKCHSGELYYTFGTITYNGLPIRDENDIPFSQVTVDRWAAFARTYSPNPDVAFLKARGFTNSTWEVSNSDPWQKLSAGGDDGKTLRVLQWPSKQAGFQVFGNQQQCDALGFPWTYYENL